MRSLPSADVKPVGRYLRSDQARPSVLVQRAGENYPWTVLRKGQAVSTAHTLVSLPGYESLVVMDNGLRLNLWGSLPQLSNTVRESAVMLNVADPGVDLDLTLDRGRVEINRADTAGKAHVRLRFLREVWDVFLDEPNSKVCVELLQPRVAQVQRIFGLFSRGKVNVKTGRKEYSFSTPTRLAWSRRSPRRSLKHSDLTIQEEWEKPLVVSAMTKDVLLSLGDWALKRLDKSSDVIESIVLITSDARQDTTDRSIGLWFLAALEEVSLLTEYLAVSDANPAEIRTAAMYGLRTGSRGTASGALR